jgi:hypothetical protein
MRLQFAEEQQRLVREYTDGTSEEKLMLEMRYGRRQLQRLVDNALSEEWVTGNSQKCPRCNVSIEVKHFFLALHTFYLLKNLAAIKFSFLAVMEIILQI